MINGIPQIEINCLYKKSVVTTISERQLLDNTISNQSTYRYCKHCSI